jgi:isopentenyl-diphosphate delta-isomerase
VKEQEVILVNENDEPVGTMEKMAAHRAGLLHRAFSVFVFNQKGDMLLQQRALHKYHSGGLWTNTCCGHPNPGEATAAAAERRLNEEMGFSITLHKVFDFTYKTGFDNGLTEYEFDHVYAGIYEGAVNPDRNEVKDFCYKGMDAIKETLQVHPLKFTAWFRIAFPLLEQQVRAGAIIKNVA